MAVKLPPIPRLPIGENFEWREWFRKLRELASSVAGIAFNSLDFTDSNITSILTRRHNDLQSIQGGASGQYYHLTLEQYNATSNAPRGSFQDYSATTLSSAINNSVTTIPVVDTDGAYPFASANTIRIDSELISYTGITSTSFTGCTRGAYGTTAASHSSGKAVVASHATTANTAKAIPFNITDFSNNISIVSSTQLKVTTAGLYNFQWSGQFVNTDTNPQDAFIWIRVNGTDVPLSAGQVSVPNSHGGVDGHTVASWNYFVQLAANSYVELYWANANQNVILTSLPAQSFCPASAAVIATMSYISP